MKKLLLKLLFAPEALVPWAKRHGLHRFVFFRWIIDLILLPADFVIVNSLFKKNNNGQSIHVFSPRTFNEWILSSKLRIRKKRFFVLCDKIAVRDYVSDMIGSQYLPKLYWTGTNLRNVDKASLPRQFVIKANHTSGTLFLVKDKELFDWDAACKATDEWLSLDYAKKSAEWQYRWIQPKLLIEEYLDSENGLAPNDYKFHCMNGHVTCMEYHTDRFLKSRTITTFSRTFKRLAMEQMEHPASNREISPPPDFTTMLHFAEMMSKNEKYARIDFYDCGSLHFGEITLHPAGGNIRFTDKKWDTILYKSFKNYEIFDGNEII